MKSTQDMQILLVNLAVKLNCELLSIEQFSDKSFNIHKYSTEHSEVIYSSSDDESNTLDINDFAYYNSDEWISIIELFAKQSDPLKDEFPSPAKVETNAVLFKGTQI